MLLLILLCVVVNPAVFVVFISLLCEIIPPIYKILIDLNQINILEQKAIFDEIPVKELAKEMEKLEFEIDSFEKKILTTDRWQLLGYHSFRYCSFCRLFDRTYLVVRLR